MNYIDCFVFYSRIQRLNPTGGGGRIFSDEQEIDIVDIGNNAIKLLEIQDRVLADKMTLENMNMVSTTTARVIEKNKIKMKQ